MRSPFLQASNGVFTADELIVGTDLSFALGAILLMTFELGLSASCSFFDFFEPLLKFKGRFSSTPSSSLFRFAEALVGSCDSFSPTVFMIDLGCPDCFPIRNGDN